MYMMLYTYTDDIHVIKAKIWIHDWPFDFNTQNVLKMQCISVELFPPPSHFDIFF